MKQNIILIILTILLGHVSTAQDKDSVKMLPPVTVTPASNVNEQVTKSFNKSFKNAVNSKWYQMDKDYLVKFIQDDMSNNAYFKENGKMVYNISYGYEKNLALDMKQMISSAYPEYTISRAIHVKAQNRDVWVINLEGLKRWIMVGIEEGELQELKNFEKG